MPIDLGQADPQRSERYRPEPEPPEMGAVTAVSFEMAMAGLNPGGLLIPDGNLHRFDIEPGDRAGWYVLYLDGIPAAAYGNWRTGLHKTWCAKRRGDLSAGQWAEHEHRMVEAKQRRDQEQQLDWEAARDRLLPLFETAGPASPEHGYFRRKGVKPYGDIRQVENRLLIPLRDEHGQFWTYQEIYHEKRVFGPNGKPRDKNFPKGGRKSGNFFTIPGDNKFYLCEGYATGASIHEVTGGTVFVAFDAGNLHGVALKIRNMYPASPITVCADNDRHKPEAGNPGLTSGRKAAKAINASLAYPKFADSSDPGTDFNDLAASAGLEAVKIQVNAPVGKVPFPPQGPEATNFSKLVHSRPVPLQYIFRYHDQGLIPRGVVGVLTATGGTGKTFFLLSLALAAASGCNFGPINAPKPVNTLVIVGEETKGELIRRAWDAAKGQFPPPFHAVSVYGEVGPLMRLDGASPVLADGFYWLEETIKLHVGLELLILDPKSRFYGLDENNAEHATQWIQMLEGLSKGHGLTILFSHHTSKDQSGRISQNMSRGSSAIVDGCRWQGGLVRMDKDTAERLGIETPRQYVLFGVPKSNYAADLPGTIIFKRNESGVLEYDEPGLIHLENMATALLEMIKNDPTEYSKRDLIKESAGKEIAAELKEAFPGFRRRTDMERAINWLLQRGRLNAETVHSVRSAKEVLRVCRHA